LQALAGERVLLRRWRDEDRAPFAALNADARVMEYFPEPLDRARSDAMIDRIEENFDSRGYALWAVEVPGVAPFIGFCGLAIPGFTAHFTPCVEIGWRLAADYWGRGYASEAARLSLNHGFGSFGFSEIVAFTAVDNRRSRAVMERLGMRYDPADDFDMPTIPSGHPLRRHVLYRQQAPRA
jgi:RimJ/RimL family protein N-acetyltransferase